LLILSSEDTVRLEDVDMLAGETSSAPTLEGHLLSSDTFSDFKHGAERAFINQKLQEHDWNVAETARRIVMPRSNLYKKIEKYGLIRDS
tara:strand:- start:212 stop:478 length:267 start_codon:yes stop_codon:yes gene_type:complete